MKKTLLKNFVTISLLIMFSFFLFSQGNLVISSHSGELWSSVAMKLIDHFHNNTFFQNDTLWIYICFLLLIPHFIIFIFLRKKYPGYLDYVNFSLTVLLLLFIVFIYPPFEKQYFMSG